MKIRNLNLIHKLNEESLKNSKKKKVSKPKQDEDWAPVGNKKRYKLK